MPDVLTGTLRDPTAAFDFKFGAQGITPGWEARLRNNLPDASAGIPLTEVRPYRGPAQRVTGIGAAVAYAK